MIQLFKLPEEIDEARAYFLDALTPHTFTAQDGTVLPYRLYIPPCYVPTAAYPLQIHMHGGGIRGNDNAFQLYHDTEQTQMLFAHAYFEPYIFAIPQCPVGYFWSEFQAKNWPENTKPYLSMKETEENRITHAVYELTEYLSEMYAVDKDRRYLSGFSLGASGAYELVYRYPDTYAAALVGCGVSDPETADIAARVPFYIIHGAMDPTIPVRHSRDMASALQKNGGDFVYVELPDATHNFFACVPNTPELTEDGMRWIHSKRRIPK